MSNNFGYPLYGGLYNTNPRAVAPQQTGNFSSKKVILILDGFTSGFVPMMGNQYSKQFLF